MENTCEILKFITDLECLFYIYVVDLNLLIIVLCLSALKLSIQNNHSEEADVVIQLSNIFTNYEGRLKILY